MPPPLPLAREAVRSPSIPCAASSTIRASRARATPSTSASTYRRVTAPPSTRSRRASVFIENHGHAVAVLAPGGRASATGTSSRPSPTTSRSGCISCSGGSRPAGATSTSPRASRARYLDPIRPGAIHPFVDVGHPTVSQIMFRRGKKDVNPERIKGRVKICCVAYDTTPIHVPKPWSHMPVAPARLRFRVMCAGRCVQPLRPGRRSARLPQGRRVPRRLRPGHAPEPPNKPGHYCFNLAHDWNSAAFANGSYLLEVQAADAHGNRATSALPFKIRN